MGKITIKELYDLMDKDEENFCIYVWSMDGMIFYNCINSVYGIETVKEEILNTRIEKLKCGFGCMSAFINI